jgi:hypothetical protein
LQNIFQGTARLEYEETFKPSVQDEELHYEVEVLDAQRKPAVMEPPTDEDAEDLSSNTDGDDEDDF